MARTSNGRQASPISHHQALIYLMVLVSAADGDMTDTELKTIGDIVTHFPVFRDFNPERLVAVAEEAGEILGSDDGLKTVLKLAAGALPDNLLETAYACAVDVAAADEAVDQEELRVLELIRHNLKIDRLAGAAIERAARARHQTA